MAKPARSRSKSSPRRKGSAGGSSASAKGKHLVIVESPAKAKTINRYLGADYTVQASVGHVRDLPRKAPKGSKQPVPGVDLENGFEPTYEVLSAKRKTLDALKKAARDATDVWFATDLDREGEAIAWHLAQELGVDPTVAKRVIFNAITKSQIEHAFANPHAIDMFKVNAQQGTGSSATRCHRCCGRRWPAASAPAGSSRWR
jgi:DNA topoisomerase-1